MNIYSKTEHGEILHIIHRKKDFEDGRVDLVDGENYLQCATLKLPKHQTFKPHKHVMKDGEPDCIAQESWVVIRGSVKVTLYDLDDTILHEDILVAGDISITLYGGHNYSIMEDDTLVYEFKTGPYYGQQLDKVFI